MIFYVLDLGMFSSDDDFAENAVEIKADGPAAAAREWASDLDEQHDGMRAECLVSETKDGEGAQRYVVTTCVKWSWDARMVKPRG